MELDELMDFLRKGGNINDFVSKIASDPLLGMREIGMNANSLQPADPTNRPYTGAGISSMTEASAPQLVNKNITGVTIPNDIKNIRNGSFVAYAPDKDQFYTRAHEYEHALANQGLGDARQINDKYIELRNPKDYYPYETLANTVGRLVDAGPHLRDNWGLPADDVKNGYFSEGMKGNPSLNELFASLSALEQMKNKKLTDDPYIRKNVFRTPEEREAYDAVTGLRQARLDAKDLPPYTRLDENRKPLGSPTVAKPSALEQILKMLHLK